MHEQAKQEEGSDGQHGSAWTGVGKEKCCWVRKGEVVYHEQQSNRKVTTSEPYLPTQAQIAKDNFRMQWNFVCCNKEKEEQR